MNCFQPAQEKIIFLYLFLGLLLITWYIIKGGFHIINVDIIYQYYQWFDIINGLILSMLLLV